MKTLCIDTSHKHLVIVLCEDGMIVKSLSQVCWKKQSEMMFPNLIQLMEEANWNVDDIQQVVITDGPGSYTGVRIAMSAAKVLCTQKKIPLYTISTLALYAGLQEDVFVLMDARSKRAYCAHYQNAILQKDECIMTLDEITSYISDYQGVICGDGDIIQVNCEDVDLAKHFVQLLPYAKKVENIHTLVPRYLKDNDAYMVKS